MLFFKKLYPFSFNYCRKSGRNSTGRITSWSRKTIVFRSSVISYFRVGLFKVCWLTSLSWNRSLIAFCIDKLGMISVWPYPRGAEYLCNSFKPRPPKLGTTMPLKWVPVGARVCWLNFYSRGAGSSVQILRHKLNKTQCKLPSKKIIWLDSKILCLIGQNGNSQIKFKKFRSAGDSVWLGYRPSVRGVAMNPVDHPHGGGQGKTSGGRPGVTPWGKLTKGYKTRRFTKNKNSKSK